MQRGRSVTGPLRRAHPASGATWNVQVVRGKMSSQCLWHACRALSAGLLLMLIGGAMAVIGYYAETLSVAQELRGNATVAVKDETRTFHLNNLSYAGPIVMGFGGFIVVAACVMTFEARDSAAKVTPARPTATPRTVTAARRPTCAGPARWDQLGVYRLPALPPLPLSLPHPLALPHQHLHSHRRSHTRHRVEAGRCSGRGNAGAVSVAGPARCGSAPDLRAPPRTLHAALPPRRYLKRYALSVDEPPRSNLNSVGKAAAGGGSCGGAAESECGSQSSLALDLHYGCGGSGAGARGAAVTLRVTDNTRRRTLARQPRLRDEPPSPSACPSPSAYPTPPYPPATNAGGVQEKTIIPSLYFKRENTAPAAGTESTAKEEAPPRACSAPPRAPSDCSESSVATSIQASHSQSCLLPKHISTETCITIDENISPGIEEEPEMNLPQAADVHIDDVLSNEDLLQINNCFTSNNHETKDDNIEHGNLKSSTSVSMIENSVNNQVETNGFLALENDRQETTKEVENTRLHFECEKPKQNDKNSSEDNSIEVTDKSSDTE